MSVHGSRHPMGRKWPSDLGESLLPEAITARLAMEFGREVFAVPGNATQPVSFAPNPLIKQGAKLVSGAEDVMESCLRRSAPRSFRPNDQKPRRRICW